jgi:Xaa-Pro aminopeptidase
MSNQELERARAELRKSGADWALLSSAENVTYVSHFETPVAFGALAALGYGEPLALMGVNDAASALVVGNFYAGWAKEQSAVDEVVAYESGLPYERISPRNNYAAALRDTLTKLGLKQGRARLAIEERTLPAAALVLLQAEFPNVELIEASPALTAARLIKTERELDLLRFAADANKAAHQELRRQTRDAGKNEHDIWGAVIGALEHAIGHQVHVFGELVTGPRVRQVAVPGGPIDRVTQPGDLALMDMSPRVNGYWSDCTNTMVVGGVEPTAKQKQYGIAAREAFEAAFETMRPGRQARDAFNAAKQTFEKHGLEIGHYVGHQIGTSVNEEPRLMPYEDMTLQAGMVFSIECGAYEGAQGDTGARMEKSVIIHANGPELLCDFEWGF